MSHTSTTGELQAWRQVAHAQAIVTERLEGALAANDLPSLAWCDVLISLTDSPDRRLRMYELAGAVVMSRSGLTRLVDRIETAGLLRREVCPNDRRGAFVALTGAGAMLLTRIRPVYRDALHEHFARHLDDPDHIAQALAPITRAACQAVHDEEAAAVSS